MAQVKITGLPAMDTIADNDILAGVDISDTTTKKVAMSLLKNYILGGMDLSDYVKFTDYANSTTGGVIKTGAYGIGITSSGNLTSSVRTYEQYTNDGNQYFISKGTLENVITGKNLANKQYVEDYVNSLDARGVEY